MIRAVMVLVVFVLTLGACTQRLICPAYQSAFIHDRESLQKKFSYMKEDSTPKILTASKTKYLIAVPESYRKKLRNLQTVEMKPIYPKIPDSLKIDEGEELLMAERDVIDSTAQPAAKPGDSLDTQASEYMITKDREVRIRRHAHPDSIAYDSIRKVYDWYYFPGLPAPPEYNVKEIRYNVEQDNYMWYFRNILILPDVRASLEEKQNPKTGDGNAAASIKQKKKSFSFKNLFRKKAKDSTQVNAPVPGDSTSGVKPDGASEKRKSRKERKSEEKPKDSGKKEDDDGF